MKEGKQRKMETSNPLGFRVGRMDMRSKLGLGRQVIGFGLGMYGFEDFRFRSQVLGRPCIQYEKHVPKGTWAFGYFPNPGMYERPSYHISYVYLFI